MHAPEPSSRVWVGLQALLYAVLALLEVRSWGLDLAAWPCGTLLSLPQAVMMVGSSALSVPLVGP